MTSSNSIRRVYVGGLRNEVKENDVEDIFRPFGLLTSVWVAKKPPGFGFVEFADAENAEEAVNELCKNKTELMGQVLKIELSDPMKSTNARTRNFALSRDDRDKREDRYAASSGRSRYDRDRDDDYYYRTRDRDYDRYRDRGRYYDIRSSRPEYRERERSRDERYRDIPVHHSSRTEYRDRPRDPVYERDSSLRYMVRDRERERKRSISPLPARSYAESSPIRRSKSPVVRNRNYRDERYETVKSLRRDDHDIIDREGDGEKDQDRVRHREPVARREEPDDTRRVEVSREKRY